MKKNNKKGFTLVELVIVVAVMAILVAVAIPTVSSITKSAKDSVNDSNARTIESVIKLAEAEASTDEGAADGVATLSDGDIFDAIYDAKLGIENAKFVYNKTNGTVKVGSTAGTDEVLIEFAATTGALKVGAVTAHS